MGQPIVLSNGQHEIRIYMVQNRGRAVYQLSYYKNYVRNIPITFGNWAKANRYLPANRPTEFDGLMLSVATRAPMAHC
ncbi:MAG: hypothetical protein EXS37_21705 [Opitutus sp.]|nr:hypothetical protein [Opitutus sp.]